MREEVLSPIVLKASKRMLLALLAACLVGMVALFRVSVRSAESLYEGFLELPVPVVLLSLWLAGAAPIGLGILTLYYLFWLLLEPLVGL